MNIKIELTQNPKIKPDDCNLPFGKIFTDHMFVMDYTAGIGWHNPTIMPYQPMLFNPATMVFHYGQASFEGLKAYKTKSGKINLFRPHKNMERMNRTHQRLCIPEIDVDFAVEAIKKLVSIDSEWVPKCEGTSLYIRPFVISTDSYLGVKPSDTYKFFVIMCPVGAYYPEGLNPVKIFVETNYVRAARGGIGNAKTPGNYAASLKSQVEAQKKGYTQVLWLDGVERKYVEEVGTMNVFFVINNEVITPSLQSKTILDGITRNSTIALLKSWNIPVREESISIEEIFAYQQNNSLNEAFGTGTAAVISPIGQLIWGNKVIIINNYEIGPLSNKLYKTITGIQNGEIEDSLDWITIID